MLNQAPKPNGFTLIGVLIATIMMAAAVITLIQLLLQGEKIVEDARGRFIAALLAQEGLELVQNVRDTNWFTGEEGQWLQNGICSQDDTQVTGQHQVLVDSEIVYNSDPLPEAGDPQLYLTANGWTHEPSNAPTRYERLITVDCSTAAEAELPYVTITATINWQERGEDKELDMSQKLYDWYFTPSEA